VIKAHLITDPGKEAGVIGPRHGVCQTRRQPPLDTGRANIDLFNGKAENARSIRDEGCDRAIVKSVTAVFSNNQKPFIRPRANTSRNQILGASSEVEGG
jgi:hypothetical protein